MKFFILFFLLLSMLACSSVPNKEGLTEAEVLYKNAKEAIAKKNYFQAGLDLNNLKSKHSYSFYAIDAELLLADIEFAQKNYVEAANQYRIFRELHPTYKNSDYVLNQMAIAYKEQVPSTYDRDLGALYQSMNLFRELVIKYPTSIYFEGAQKELQKGNEVIIKKERYIADFYFRTKSYQSARYRYLDILKSYNEPALVQEGVERILISTLKLKEYEQCEQIAGEFGAQYVDQLSKITEIKNRCSALKAKGSTL